MPVLHESRLLDALQAQSSLSPDRVVLDNGETSLTAHSLWQRVSQCRQHLMANDYRNIALVGDNTLGWIISDLALLGLPVRVVPLPAFFSPTQRAHVFATAHIDTIIGPRTALDELTDDTRISTVTSIDEALDLYVARVIVPDAGMSMDQPATQVACYEKVTFTSGSTGQAKGVRLSLSTLENTAQAIAEAMQPLALESHLGVLPFATLLENIAGLYAPLLQGVRVHVRRMAQLGLASPANFNPFLLLDTFQRVQPQASILVPQLLLALVTLRERGMSVGDQLRFLAVGGGKVAPQLLEKARLFDLPVFEGYGLSECGSVVALNLPGAHRPGSVGRPLSHCRIRVADDGEIMVRGSVMSAYLDEHTPAGDNPQELATGDLGHVDADGFLYVKGRKKNMFITAFGRNINPEWIEAELARYLPIAQAAVFGEALPQPIAVVVARSGFSASDMEASIADCNQHLPDYARISRIIVSPTPFNVENGLATANGRLRRQDIENAFKTSLIPSPLSLGEAS